MFREKTGVITYKNVMGKRSIIYDIAKDWQLYVLLLPGIVFYVIFRYIPMYGVIIAFKDYGIFTGISKSLWVGLKYFDAFFTSEDFFVLFKNTLLLGVYTVVWSFPFPVLFAIFLNELSSKKFRKFVQTASYLPSFLSVVVICSMVTDFLSPNNGIINRVLTSLGVSEQYFLIMPQWFRTIYITSEIWQYMGHNAIIYISALTTIDVEQYEAAKIDGCGRLRTIWNITLPGILPTVTTMFIIKSGSIFKIGFEKVLLLYNPSTYSVADVFSTYVYRKGLIDTNYSYATAVGLFESLVALIIVLTFNWLSKKFNDNSLW